MKRITVLFFLLPLVVFGQNNSTLSLQQAYDLAQKNYPLIKQRELMKKTMGFTIDNLNKGYLPQFSLGGQATYQSEVTDINIPIPGFKFNPPSKDQYKILADLNQTIYDGGMIRQQKNIQRLNNDVEEQSIEVELYKIKDRINQLFLGVLYFDEQLRQLELIKEDINDGIKKVQAQVNNGVALRSNLNLLQAELLKTEQRGIELKASRKGLIGVLSLFINQPLPENIQLEKPIVPATISNDIQRPELQLFSYQDKLLGSQTKLIDARNLPKANFFAEGGYGKPGLNFLKNQFDFFYTTGVRFNWSFGGLYTQKKEKKLIDINKKIVDIQKETFLFNTNTALKQQQSEIEKYQKLIITDQQIIDLRVKVKQAANAQLENSVITTNDYLQEVNEEDQARQDLIIHQIQLLQAQINYLTLAGKQ
ncbi:MAG TPA: TolC family protein [Chitinophagaceae bacterium]|nr:TolC family protein [Chitinophagaceae bacterium]